MKPENKKPKQKELEFQDKVMERVSKADAEALPRLLDQVEQAEENKSVPSRFHKFSKGDK